MRQIILDLGSGNSCRNSVPIVDAMIDAVADTDPHREGYEIILKWQLEMLDPPGQRRLYQATFAHAYQYAKTKGYKTTSSVFDLESMRFLLGFDVPFVKIACNPALYWLAGEVPRKVPVYASWDARGANSPPYRLPGSYCWLACVPKYPALLAEYEDHAGPPWVTVSDHSPGLELWNKYKPRIWEKHFVLSYLDPGNPDAGTFAITPKELKEVLESV